MAIIGPRSWKRLGCLLISQELHQPLKLYFSQCWFKSIIMVLIMLTSWKISVPFYFAAKCRAYRHCFHIVRYYFYWILLNAPKWTTFHLNRRHGTKIHHTQGRNQITVISSVLHNDVGLQCLLALITINRLGFRMPDKLTCALFQYSSTQNEISITGVSVSKLIHFVFLVKLENKVEL